MTPFVRHFFSVGYVFHSNRCFLNVPKLKLSDPVVPHCFFLRYLPENFSEFQRMLRGVSGRTFASRYRAWKPSKAIKCCEWRPLVHVKISGFLVQLAHQRCYYTYATATAIGHESRRWRFFLRSYYWKFPTAGLTTPYPPFRIVCRRSPCGSVNPFYV